MNIATTVDLYGLCQSCVPMLGAGLDSCAAVQLCPEESLSLLTACYKQGEKTFAAVVPPLAIQFISAHTLIHFLLWGNISSLQDGFLLILG